MNDILNKLHEVAASPRAQMDGYLSQGKKIVLCAPVYTPEELIHAMGFVPMGAWGGDVALNRAKEYCPAFLCAIVQSLSWASTVPTRARPLSSSPPCAIPSRPWARTGSTPCRPSPSSP